MPRLKKRKQEDMSNHPVTWEEVDLLPVISQASPTAALDLRNENTDCSSRDCSDSVVLQQTSPEVGECCDSASDSRGDLKMLQTGSREPRVSTPSPAATSPRSRAPRVARTSPHVSLPLVRRHCAVSGAPQPPAATSAGKNDGAALQHGQGGTRSVPSSSASAPSIIPLLTPARESDPGKVNACAGSNERPGEEKQKDDMAALEATDEGIASDVLLQARKTVPMGSPKMQKKIEGPRLLSVETHAPTPRSAGRPEVVAAPRTHSASSRGSGEGIEEEREDSSLAGGGDEAALECTGGRARGNQTPREDTMEAGRGNPLPSEEEVSGHNAGLGCNTAASEEESSSHAPVLQDVPAAALERASVPPRSDLPEIARNALPALSCMQQRSEEAGTEAARCTRTLSDSSSSMTSARRLVAEAGRSFKLKFLQHRNNNGGLLRDVPETLGGSDSLLVTPVVREKTARSPAPHAQKAGMCLLSSHLLLSRSSNGSCWSLPSSRRCDACIAAACDRILADASPTAAAALRMLASPARRGVLCEDRAYDFLLAEATPAATAAIRQLATRSRSGGSGDDAALAQGARSPKGLSEKKHDAIERRQTDSGKATGPLVDKKTERKPLVSADARELLWWLSRHLSDVRPTQGLGGKARNAEAGSSLRGGRLRASSKTRALQLVHALGKAAGSNGPSSAQQQPCKSKAPSPFHGAPSLNGQPHNRVYVTGAPAIPRRQKSQGRLALCESRTPEMGRATAVPAEGSCPQKGSAKVSAGLSETKLILGSSNYKSAGPRRPKTPQRSRTEGAVGKLASPIIRRPTSASGERFPGERPPWDFSSAPRQEGPRMPFRTLIRKERSTNRELESWTKNVHSSRSPQPRRGSGERRSAAGDTTDWTPAT